MTDKGFSYTLIKSKRKTLSLQVADNGLIVRAPNRTTKREADAFVDRHAAWIEKQREKLRQRERIRQSVPKLSEPELRELYDRAAEYIPGRVGYYARKLGVSCGRITIRCQKSRWGSCSAKKNLNFNCLLMLTPPEAIDSVVVHELCHLVEMNHSKRFYDLLLGIYPDYRTWDRWLKENGAAIMARVERE